MTSHAKERRKEKPKVLTGSTANEAADIGRALGVQPDTMQLWNSFLGYLLLSAKAKSGLEADRFPETAKQALRLML
jgi:hypothetical protein